MVEAVVTGDETAVTGVTVVTGETGETVVTGVTVETALTGEL